MGSIDFDYAIIGRGAAGLQLALAMQDDPFFNTKKLVLIDRADKDLHDKRWCFWEIGKGKWDSLISHQWEQAHFFSARKDIPLKLLPYRYKMLHSGTFNAYAEKTLSPRSNIAWENDEVQQVTELADRVIIQGKNKAYSAKMCFDSRIDSAYFNNEGRYLNVLQHFKGYLIEFKTPVFNPEKITLMDFRAAYKQQTSFMYVLPMTSHKALVEFTLFTPDLLEDETYDREIKTYIPKYISAEPYTISETEKGIIPMSNFPFHHYSTGRIIKIGTAGSWVRPSTGYSFKNTEHYVSLMLQNIKAGKKAQDQLFIKKYQYFDSLMLDVLQYENSKGPRLFEEMYTNNSIQRIFRFLDGKTSWWEDAQIIFSFNPLPFIKAIWRRLFLFLVLSRQNKFLRVLHAKFSILLTNRYRTRY